MAEWPPRDEKNDQTTDGKKIKVKDDDNAQSRNELELRAKVNELTQKMDNARQEKKEHQKAEDHTGIVTGLAAGGPTVVLDHAPSLSLEAKICLLKENNIFADIGAAARVGDLSSGMMNALTLGTDLGPAQRRGVYFDRIEVLKPPADRIYHSGIAYQEFESKLQRQTITQTDLGIGIPKIFNLDASYSTTSATSTLDHKVTIYFHSSLTVPKAWVSFGQGDIRPAPELIAKITAACAAETSEEQADQLLACLTDYGHFVPRSIFLGGQLTLSKATELKQRSEYESRKQALTTAANARFAAGGLPIPDKKVEAGGGTGRSDSTETSKNSVIQMSELTETVMGGDPSLAGSKGADFGTAWIPSVGPFMNWTTIGYNTGSLVPTIEYLSQDLKEHCKQILRNYFIRQLDRAESPVAGAANFSKSSNFSKSWSDIPIYRIKRITEIMVNYGINVDGLRWSYELHGEGGTKVATTDWIGWRHGQQDSRIELQADEEIIAVEAGIGEPAAPPGISIDPNAGLPILRKIAFVTNRRRFPTEGYYGKATTHDVVVIRAPRVRALFTHSHQMIHGVGLSYLGLANNTKSREYLLAMEPYLFPKHDYGVTA